MTRRNDEGGPVAPRDPGILGRYRIERELGRGGMGEVLLAHDTLLDRRVALKRLLTTGVDDSPNRESIRASILKEARRASQISDRHVAAIHDVLDLENQVVLVMEYVDGQTLRGRLEQPLSIDTFWDLAPQCVEGIAVAHSHGVIHRDLKPENLMVTREGVVKILDFGIAKRAPDSPGITSTSTESMSGLIAGTPQYMAPEAHLGLGVDERTDIFALGAVFYEMLTSRKPFEGTTYAAVVDRVLNVDPEPVVTINPAAGSALSQVVTRMLAKSPAERFSTTGELKAALEQARAGAAPAWRPAPAPAPRPEKAALPSRSLPWKWIVAAFAVTLAVVFVLAWKTLVSPFPRKPNVAVLAPPITADSDLANFSLGAVELLCRRLRRQTQDPRFRMAAFSDVVDQKVTNAEEARRILGANLVLIPAIERDPDVLRARFELLETQHGRPIARRTIEAPVTEPFQFMDRTYRAATELLRSDPQGGLDSGIRGAGTLRFYLQGMGRLRATKPQADAEAAVAELESAVRTEPDGAVVRAGLANTQLAVYLRGGDSTWLARAETSAREAVGLDSSRAEPHRVLGNVLATQRRNAEALDALTRAHALDPTDIDVTLKRARLFGRLGQPEREHAAYLAAIAESPDAWQPRWWIASWYFQKGRVDESIAAYREMVRLTPDFYLGYANLGALLVQRGDYARAIDTLRVALELRPTESIYDNLGTAYFNSGRIQESVDAYNQSFQFGTAGYVSWLNLGDAYSWLQGRKADADKAYAEGIRLGREEIAGSARRGGTFNPIIPGDLAIIFARMGQPDSARIYLARAVSADSTNSRVAYCAALTHWLLGDRPQAIEWLTRCVRGGYPTAWLRDSPIFTEWRAVPEFRALVGRGAS